MKGNGLEIGGMHKPLLLPKKCSVKYLDIESTSIIESLFTELKDTNYVKLDYIGDIVKSPISEITNTQFDFIIINHVIEHVANPIQAIENVWGGIKENGWLVISIPDKNYTFDKDRPLTTFEHLLADYRQGINIVSDEHYTEFVKDVLPGALSNNESFMNALSLARRRREHVHVWNSLTFKDHLVKIFDILGIEYRILYESYGTENCQEYFAIIQKGENGRPIPNVKITALSAFYKYRYFLKKGFSKYIGKYFTRPYSKG